MLALFAEDVDETVPEQSGCEVLNCREWCCKIMINHIISHARAGPPESKTCIWRSVTEDGKQRAVAEPCLPASNNFLVQAL